jgi:hypothetical protein
MFRLRACAVGLFRMSRIFFFCVRNGIRRPEKLTAKPSTIMYLHLTKHLADALLPPVISASPSQQFIVLSDVISVEKGRELYGANFFSYINQIRLDDFVVGLLYNMAILFQTIFLHAFRFDISFCDQKRRAISSAYFRFLTAEYLSLHVARRAITRIFRRIRPTVVVGVDPANPIVRTIFDISNQGSHAVCLQGALSASWSIEWRFLNCDVVCVWGRYFAKLIESQGAPPSAITVTGSPRYDKYIHEISISNVSLEKIVVLVLSTFNTDGYQRYSPRDVLELMKRDILEVAECRPDIEFLVKPHPSEELSDAYRALSLPINVSILDGRSSLSGSLKRCNVVLSFGSTATLDACLEGKIIGLMGYRGWHWIESFSPLPTCKVINSRFGLEEFLRDVHVRDSHASKTGSLDDIVEAGWLYRGCASDQIKLVIDGGKGYVNN